jgi:type IV secretion system T-DNA border endonuclease VirD2
MADSDDHIWRLPNSVHGKDVKLKGGGKTRSLSSSGKARLGRIVGKAPEVMVKITGRSRGSAGHLKAHMDYITRNGRLQGETQDGDRITDRAALRALHEDWMLANAADARERTQRDAKRRCHSFDAARLASRSCRGCGPNMGERDVRR